MSKGAFVCFWVLKVKDDRLHVSSAVADEASAVELCSVKDVVLIEDVFTAVPGDDHTNRSQYFGRCFLHRLPLEIS
jgi:hypothetical protein